MSLFLRADFYIEIFWKKGYVANRAPIYPNNIGRVGERGYIGTPP